MRAFPHTGLIVVFICFSSGVSPASARADMTYAEYESQLGSAQQREKNAKEEIAQEQTKIESVKQQLAEIQPRLAMAQREMDSLLQIVKQDSSRAQSRVKTPPPVETPAQPTSYAVRLVFHKRESLSRIAGYDFVYGDTARWHELYRANKSGIDGKYQRYKNRRGTDCRYGRAADLIFPGQVLDIPR
jgi:nucleoid-associated protein YgaU